MLIEFNVENFRSIRGTQTLSLAASKYYKGLEESNCFASGVGGLPPLLRSAVVYGPNAAGKSNLFRALQFMQAFVRQSHAHQEGQPIAHAPFALSQESRNEPSTFELFFVQENIRYQFGFAITANRVIREWLLAFPEGKAQRWYERSVNPSNQKEEWYFGSKFTGRRQVWQEATRKNALFLSTAIQLNNEQLKPVFTWFANQLAIILPAAEINLQFSFEQCANEEGRQRIMEFMNAADLGIAGIEIKKMQFTMEMLPPEMPQPIREQIVRDGVPVVHFQHQTESGEAIAFPLQEESNGTQKFFAFAGPLMDVLAKGRTLFVDELDTSLHPLMVRFLINLIHNPAINRKNAQLVFTTHDTSVLDTDIFRRDQVWFIEKDSAQASRLYPLSDFSPRKGEALERGYLHGRYGALPFIGELRF